MALLACLVLAKPSSAQQQQPQEDESSYIVKTIPLRRLTSTDAMMLLTPYVAHRGTVYQAGPSIRAVTIRASTKTIADLEKVLAQYDRAPESVSLRFQLIAADYSNTRDPSVAGLDSLLRGVLKFTGYRRLSTSVANVDDGGGSAKVTMAGDGVDYEVAYNVDGVRGGADGTVRIHVMLNRIGQQIVPGRIPASSPSLMSTGLTVPDGHTVVLGSIVENAMGQPRAQNAASPSSERGLILTVTPQIIANRKDE
jgi:hypothetical protein